MSGRISPDLLPQTRDEDGRWIGGGLTQWAEELTSAVLEYGAHPFIAVGPSLNQPTLRGRRAAAIVPQHSSTCSPGESISDTALSLWAREIVPVVGEAIAEGRRARPGRMWSCATGGLFTR